MRMFLSPTCIVSLDGTSSAVFVEWSSWKWLAFGQFPLPVARIRCHAGVADLLLRRGVDGINLNVLIMHASVRSTSAETPTIDWEAIRLRRLRAMTLMNHRIKQERPYG